MKQVEISNFTEKRGSRRFPLDIALRYKVIHRRRILSAGTGRTVNMSSGGIYFIADTRLDVGTEIEMAIDWPALLDYRVPLHLTVSGNIIRARESHAVVRIQKYDFATHGKSAEQVHSFDVPPQSRFVTTSTDRRMNSR